jgi:hypothetical protein
LKGDVYKIGLPRTDLKVTADGETIKAGLALGSWMAFKRTGDHAMVMGDLVLLESEINPVLSSWKTTASRSRQSTITFSMNSRA